MSSSFHTGGRQEEVVGATAAWFTLGGARVSELPLAVTRCLSREAGAWFTLGVQPCAVRGMVQLSPCTVSHVSIIVCKFVTQL